MRISDWSSDVCSSDLLAQELSDHHIFSFSSGSTSNRSPTKPTSATWIIRASSSLLMATIALLPFMPAKCWIAPEMPTDTTTFSVATPFSFRQIARSDEHTSELQSLMRNSYAVFGLQKKKTYN